MPDPNLIFSVLVVLLVAALFFVALLFVRALLFGRVPDAVEPLRGAEVDVKAAVEHLSEVVRVPTVSEADRTRIDYSTFLTLHSELERMYPALHGCLEREVVNGYSLLYTWKGSSAELDPVLLVAHMDVVPVDEAARAEWTQPPFEGKIEDGWVWGRGSLDMKNTLVTLLEAVEGLVKSGYQPERTLYLAFGHDEEIGGAQGAGCIAALLAEREVKLAAVLDEGGCISSGLIPNLELPIALVGIAEKGFLTLELSVEGRPGHSSTPPPHTAIGVLSRALARLESRPLPPRMSMARLMFGELGAFLPLKMRLAFANFGLFGGVVRKQLARNPMTNALIRTTTAITVIEGGLKDNILPAKARALVNFRLMPGDTVESVTEYVREAVHDEAVQIQVFDQKQWEPSPVSPIDSPIYLGLAQNIRQVFPEALVVPYLVSGATDSRHFVALSESVYRFTPCLLDPELLRTIHGVNERVPVESLGRMVQFYTNLIQSWTKEEGSQVG